MNIKLPIRVAAVSTLLALPPSALALGLGPVRGPTVLGDPLALDIELAGTPPPERADIRVEIPGFSEHTRLGAPEPIVPRDLKAAVVKRPDGRTIVRLSTRDTVNEPVLRFLLRAAWPGGEVVRLYEVLLDPPLMVPPARNRVTGPTRRPVVASAAPAVRPPRAPRRSQPRPVALPPPSPPVPGSDYGPVVYGETLHAIVRGAFPGLGGGALVVADEVVRTNPHAFAGGNPDRLLEGAVLALPDSQTVSRLLGAPQVPDGTPAPAVADSYGPVRPGDTLYAIARRIGAEGWEVARTVERLHALNPDAFIDGDANRLKVGAVLRLDQAQAAPSVVAVPAPEQSAPVAVAPSPSASTPGAAERSALRTEIAGLILTLEQEAKTEVELRAELERAEKQIAELTTLEAEVSKQIEARTRALEAFEPKADSPAIEPPSNVEPQAAAAQPGTAPAPAQVQIDARAAAVAPATSPALVERVEPAGGTEVASRAMALTAPAPDAALPASDWLSRVRREPITLLAVGLGALLLVALLLFRRVRRGPQLELAGRSPSAERAVHERLAEIREEHVEPRRLEAAAVAAQAAEAADVDSDDADNVIATGPARAVELAKVAAAHMAYGQYEAAKKSIDEAIVLDPHRDEHKVVLLTLHECMGERDQARALVDDLLARRGDLTGTLRAYVDQIHSRTSN